MSQSPTTAAGAAGTWIVTIANRPEPIRLELTTDGSALAGTLDGARVVGEERNGDLVFAEPSNWAAWRAGRIGGDDAAVMYPTVVTARLADGRLTGWTDVFIRGYGPQAVKRLHWTAVRAPAR